MKPLVVKLSMIVALRLDTRRQRDSTRSTRTPRMRREPTGRGASSCSPSPQIALNSEPLSVPPRHVRQQAKGQADTKTRALDVVQRRRGSRQVHQQARDVRERRPRAASIEVFLLIRSSSSERTCVVDDLAENK